MKRIALLGMPNTGKSTLFNRLTGASARVGNWPGVTIDLLAAKVLFGSEMVEVVDLPGIYDLHGFSDDERVVRRFLESNPVDLVCVTLNATQLDHQLGLALQLRQLGLKVVALVNMIDEAQQLGIRIDPERLAQGLQCPVHLISARQGFGIGPARETMASLVGAGEAPDLADLQRHLGGDDALSEEAERLADQAVFMPATLERKTTERLDRVLLHPWLGLPLFFLAMFLVFQAVYTLGAPLQDAVAWLLDGFRDFALVPLEPRLPAAVYGLLVQGIYDGIATVASFVPVIILFFFLIAVVEDSGYLSRAAFLTDALMARLGLDGRGFVMVLMGFGCNVPALMGTRVMRSRALRLLTMLIIPFSLCSARLQVFLFIVTALFAPSQAPLVLFGLYMASFAAALGTAFLARRQLASNDPFVLELPPYRLPTVRHVLLRGWHEVRHFLRRATGFIVAGVVLVWLLTHYPDATPPGGPGSFAGMIGDFMEPLLTPIGIGSTLAVVLIFGFVAKEIVIGSLVAMTGLQGSALAAYLGQQMDAVSAISFMLFILLYTPCLSTVATLHSESRSLRFTALSVGWSLLLAWTVSFGFYQGARLLGF
jgi:ferrous iron transport protein B